MAGNSDSVYVAKKSALLTNPTAATVFLQGDNAAKAAAVYVPDQWVSAVATGQGIPTIKFTLHAYGRVTGGTTTNFTPVIQFGTSITAGSNTNCASGGAAAYNSASGIWQLDAFMVWDFTSKTINGYFTGNNASAGTIVTAAATTQLTSKDLTTSGNGFVISALFSATNAGNLAYLDFFSLEVV